MAKKQKSVSDKVALVLLGAGWIIAFGLWFKSDYAWEQMRKAQHESEINEAIRKDYAEDLEKVKSDAYFYLAGWNKCSGAWHVPNLRFTEKRGITISK